MQDSRRRASEFALDLFLKQGLHATTMDEIADTTGVSRRTLFRYFPTKEDLVLGWAVATAPELPEHLRSEDVAISPLHAANAAILGYVIAHQEDLHRSLQVARLITSTPSLKARAHEKYETWEQLLLDGLIALGVDGLSAHVAAGTSVAAHRIAVRRWSDAAGTDDLVDHLRLILTHTEHQNQKKEL